MNLLIQTLRNYLCREAKNDTEKQTALDIIVAVNTGSTIGMDMCQAQHFVGHLLFSENVSPEAINQLEYFLANNASTPSSSSPIPEDSSHGTKQEAAVTCINDSDSECEVRTESNLDVIDLTDNADNDADNNAAPIIDHNVQITEDFINRAFKHVIKKQSGTPYKQGSKDTYKSMWKRLLHVLGPQPFIDLDTFVSRFKSPTAKDTKCETEERYNAIKAFLKGLALEEKAQLVSDEHRLDMLLRTIYETEVKPGILDRQKKNPKPTKNM